MPMGGRRSRRFPDFSIDLTAPSRAGSLPQLIYCGSEPARE
ncbi:hypothetical protein PG5_39320 [Pseudomonas sp. G5(2012)]|nr:hypothetical protein PG5_39320 [Pseudomonas sp. G5(2012)]